MPRVPREDQPRYAFGRLGSVTTKLRHSAHGGRFRGRGGSARDCRNCLADIGRLRTNRKTCGSSAALIANAGEYPSPRNPRLRRQPALQRVGGVASAKVFRLADGRSRGKARTASVAGSDLAGGSAPVASAAASSPNGFLRPNRVWVALCPGDRYAGPFGQLCMKLLSSGVAIVVST